MEAADLSKIKSSFGLSHKLGRVAWGVAWTFLFRPSPRPFFKWRAFLLRCFGAKVGSSTHIYPRVRVWAPWELVVGDCSALADDVDVYCVTRIAIGKNTVVSQGAYLCAATHDYTSMRYPLIPKPVYIGDNCWVAAYAMILPGVSVHDGSVVGARAVVTRNVEAWSVVVGHPAIKIKDRVVKG